MTRSRMFVDDLNLQQLSELEYILLGDLRDVLEEESTEQNRRWLAAIVGALMNTLPREFALRSAGGYHEELVLRSPRADQEVRSLEQEQDSLAEQLSVMNAQLHDPVRFRQNAENLKQNLAAWSARLKQHNLAEERLVQEVYLSDLGGGD